MKKPVLADTTLFSEQKEPLEAVHKGEDAKELLVRLFARKAQRSLEAERIRGILALSGHVCRWHAAQLTLAELYALPFELLSHT